MKEQNTQYTLMHIIFVNYLIVGFAAGEHYSHSGGSTELLCLPSEPTWAKYDDAYLGHSFVYGVEYEVSGMSQEIFGKNFHDQNVPCVVCQSIGRVSVLRIPGTILNINDALSRYFFLSNRNERNDQDAIQ